VPDPETLLSERATRQAIQGAHRRLSRLVQTLYDIACGKNLKMFILVRHQSACPFSLIIPTCPAQNYKEHPSDQLPSPCALKQTVLSLYIASVVADCFSSLTLLYLGT